MRAREWSTASPTQAAARRPRRGLARGRHYATVAMRFALNDETLDRDSGRVLQGGPDEATEVWTFMRVRGGHWLVSAIQQS